MKIVLLPGMDGTGELFEDLIAALPDEWEVVRMRYPSDRVLSYADLRPLVEKVCSSEPFVLLAESYSTPLGIEYAASHPPNLQALILCTGFSTSPARGWRHLVAHFVGPLIFFAPLPKFAIRGWLLDGSASEALISQVKATLTHVRSDVLTRRLTDVLRCDVRALIPHISVPVLYLKATRDRLVSSHSVKEITKLRPTMEVAVLEGPHLLLQRCPSAAAHRILQFVRSLGL